MLCAPLRPFLWLSIPFLLLFNVIGVYVSACVSLCVRTDEGEHVKFLTVTKSGILENLYD